MRLGFCLTYLIVRLLFCRTLCTQHQQQKQTKVKRDVRQTFVLWPGLFWSVVLKPKRSLTGQATFLRKGLIP